MPYEEYFKAASEGLIIVDCNRLIIEVNRAAERLFRYSERELIGQPIELLLPEQLRESHRQHVEGYFAAPRTREMGNGLSLAARRKDGSEFPVEISLTYARGTRRGDLVVAAIIDISQRLALEEDVRRADSLLSLGTAAAGIAHDLRNPLQVICLKAERIKELPGTANSEINEDAAVILHQALLADRIVEQLLELSRRNGKDPVPVDINNVVDSALLLLAESMREGSINVEKSLDGKLPYILGHHVALERVLINLLTNAYDAMPQGGWIKITGGIKHHSAGWVYLTIADNGSGIAPEALGRIFDLLYTTKPNGNGLGLWLSRRIIQEHNGIIEVQSEPGKGTTFMISLPAIQSDC